MKHTVLLAVVLLSWACSRTQKTEKTVVAQLRTHKEAVDTLRTDADAPVKPLEVSGLADEKMRKIFASYDLSTCWAEEKPEAQAAAIQENSESGQNTGDEYSQAAVYNGFYGADRHRIEMYFASVKKDSLEPNVYHVAGKSRFKKNITPFAGTIVLDSIAEFKDPNISTEDLRQMEVSRLYTTSGTFRFAEDSSYAGSGVFSGKTFVDFSLKEYDDIELWFFSQTDKTKGTGFLFDGEWRSHKTGKTKPIIWAKDIFMIANDILDQFSIGERDVEINPKYRKLGWDNFWENEEWWNEPAKTAL